MIVGITVNVIPPNTPHIYGKPTGCRDGGRDPKQDSILREESTW